MRSRRKKTSVRRTCSGARFLHAALAGFFVLSSGPTGVAAVLCLGENGHIALEPASASCCSASACDEAAEAAGGTAAATSAPRGPAWGYVRPESDCRDCVDIPLIIAGSGPSLRSSKNPRDDIERSASRTLSCGELVPGDAVPPSHPVVLDEDPAPCSRRGSLIHLRTVILRF